MKLDALCCPSCGAPAHPVGGLSTCRFCGATLAAASGGATRTAIEIQVVGAPLIEVIKCVRSFSRLGLAEVQRSLGRLPATFSIEEPGLQPKAVLAKLAELGCVGCLVAESVRLSSDPELAGHDGSWGFRIERAGQVTPEAVKLVREVTDLGLAEATTVLQTPGALVPITSRASHDEIRRRFAALGYIVSFSPSGG